MADTATTARQKWLGRLAELARDRGDALELFDSEMLDVVTRARAEGATWDEVGDAVGLSRQGAQQHYGPVTG